jgi:flavodoxin
MKSIIIYYSLTGNTKEVADVLREYLKSIGDVEAIELKGLDVSNKFFNQAVRAFRHKRAKLQPVNFDLANYDLICLGTPVWAFGSTPAMNTYLDKCSGLEGKEVILFTTYSSGVGRERCLNYMQDILAKKGAKQFRRFFIQENKVNDKEQVVSKIKEIARL